MSMAEPRETGASNVEYDLIAVMYHILQGNETMTRYEQDANQTGDHETAQLFRDMREQNKQFLDRARPLLIKRISR
ncbi:MAG: hypothetical protein M0Z94_17325 [Dehalococcoidales bacterium]|nr:hypothetical protein [Dehalococcoidales bacterium]